MHCKTIVHHKFNSSEFIPFSTIQFDYLDKDNNRDALNRYAYNFCGDFFIDEDIEIIDLIERTEEWWIAYRYEIEKFLELLSLEYNPIENYSMIEQGTDKRTLNLENRTEAENIKVVISTDTENNSNTNNIDITDSTTGNITGNQTNKESDTFGNLVTRSNSETTSNNKADSTRKETNTLSSERSNDGKVDTTDIIDNLVKNTGTDTNEHYLKRSGNIGTTTTQMMLDSSIDLLPRLNIFNRIVDTWAHEVIY